MIIKRKIGRKRQAVTRSEEDPEEFLRDFLDVPGKKKRGSVREIKKILEEQYGEKISRF